ncbi:MAG: hypothetical protein ABL983_03945 [Nitrospira sp.]
MDSEPVRLKLREARYFLSRLATASKRDEFYFNANAFLTACRSVIYVASHQFGWHELKGPQQKLVPPHQVAGRKAFDAWLNSNSAVKAVLAHELVEERHDVVHRSGQAGFTYSPKPIGGVAIEAGSIFEPALMLKRGKIGLPLEDDNAFLYVDAAGTQHDAVKLCQDYFGLVLAAYEAISTYR